MDKKTKWIVLGVLGLIGAMVMGMIFGGGAVYLLTRVSSAQAGSLAETVGDFDREMGVLVDRVVSDSPAEEAGLVRGDIIVEVDGKRVESVDELYAILRGKTPGDELYLTVLHGDEVRDLVAVLSEQAGQAYLGIVPCGRWAPQNRSDQLDHFQPFGIPFQYMEGARVVEVLPDSPAAEAGIKAGDVILSVDGEKVNTSHDLKDLILARKPGDVVTLEIRDSDTGEVQRIEVTLGERAEQAGMPYLGVRYQPLGMMGASGSQGFPWNWFEEYGNEGWTESDLPEGVESGFTVTRILPGSAAEEAGLQEGDLITAIDGEKMDSVNALQDAIAKKSPGDRIVLTIYHPGSDEAVEVEVVLKENPQQPGKAMLGVETIYQRVWRIGPGSDDWKDLIKPLIPDWNNRRILPGVPGGDA